MTLVLQTPIFTQEVPEKGSVKGHVRFLSSSVLLKDIELCSFAASITSAVLYEKLQASGTTLIITVGKDSTKIDVLARYENDGVDLQWEMKPGDATKLDEVQEKIRSKTFIMMHETKSAPVQANVAPEKAISDLKSVDAKQNLPESSHEPATKVEEEKEDYLVKQLHRIP